jgi:hypothetical protein
MATRNIEERFRARVRAFFALLGSPNAGERETARAKLDEILAKHRKTWNDLADLLKAPPPPDPFSGTAPDDATASPDNASNVDALSLVSFAIRDYVAVTSEESIAITLWVAYALVYQKFNFAPRLRIFSPTSGCGKTTLLDVIGRLLPRALRCDDVTAAGLRELIAEGRWPLIDELEHKTLIRNRELYRVLVSGHRRGGFIKHAGHAFSTFMPVAFASIGGSPLPLMQRSIPIRLERRTKQDDGTPLRRLDDGSDTTLLDQAFMALWRWGKDAPRFNMDPDLPAGLRGRDADNWRPLLAIANSFSASWGELARNAALALSVGMREEDVVAMLFHDTREIFDRLAIDRIASVALVDALNNLEHGFWREWSGVNDDHQPRPLTPRDLAQLLRPFRIRSRTVWPLGRTRNSRSSAGYYKTQFEPLWESYCDDGPSEQKQARTVGAIGMAKDAA